MILIKDTFKDIAFSDIHEFDGYYIFMRKDGIMQLQFKEGFNGDADDARNMIKTFRKIMPEGRARILVIYQEDNTFSKEAREYIASDEVSTVVMADALIIKGLALTIIGNGYLRINKPKRPTRLFTSPDAGVKWLQQFIE
ncbi:MAG: hypothetical protein Q8L81_17090 [Bacteroidota bacterium]|nr:hypothetical protein [Bacteroidota bacterium]